MSVQARMTRTFEVWEREAPDATAGTATWFCLHPGLVGGLTELTPEGARRQTPGGAVDEPDVTHVVRMGTEANGVVIGGLRLRDTETGDEYLVRVARWRDAIQPGNLKVTVAAVPAATQA